MEHRDHAESDRLAAPLLAQYYVASGQRTRTAPEARLDELVPPSRNRRVSAPERDPDGTAALGGARLYRPGRLGRLPPREAGAADVDGRQTLDRRDDGPRRGVYSAEVANVRRVPAFPAGVVVLTEQLPT